MLQIGTWAHACMGSNSFKVVLQRYLLLAHLGSFSFALVSITGLCIYLAIICNATAFWFLLVVTKIPIFCQVFGPLH